MRFRRVILESPYSGDVERNVRYLERLIRACVLNGWSPYASHRMLCGALDDNDHEQRQMGMAAGFAFHELCGLQVFGLDYGWSSGMLEGAKRFQQRNPGANMVGVMIGKNDKPSPCWGLIENVKPGEFWPDPF